MTRTTTGTNEEPTPAWTWADYVTRQQQLRDAAARAFRRALRFGGRR